MERIPKTQKKLREARFFLGRMSKAVKSTNLEQEDFEFFLSAFLSAGRSVTFFLNVEQADVYKRWFDGWEKALDAENRELLKLMNQQRIAEVHQGGADVQAEIEMVQVTELERSREGTLGTAFFGGTRWVRHLLKSQEGLTIFTGLLAEKKSWERADLISGCSNGWCEILNKFSPVSPDSQSSCRKPQSSIACNLFILRTNQLEPKALPKPQPFHTTFVHFLLGALYAQLDYFRVRRGTIPRGAANRELSWKRNGRS